MLHLFGEYKEKMKIDLKLVQKICSTIAQTLSTQVTKLNPKRLFLLGLHEKSIYKDLFLACKF